MKENSSNTCFFRAFTNKTFLFFFFLCSFLFSQFLSLCKAQTPNDSPTGQTPALSPELTELQFRHFDEVSPFFFETDPSKLALASAYQRELNQKEEERTKQTSQKMPFFATFKNFLQNISQEFVPEQKQAHNEEISLSVTPSPSFPISSYYEIHAKFTIRNNTNRLILLEFPSTQTFDLVLLDPNGSEIERWSTDQRFEEIPSFITINPKEKVVFSGSLSTRNLLPAKTYILYASIPGYPHYSSKIQILPQ